ncbi:MAG: CHAT domain-containing protein, partial [Candidatus Thorarchaeota archaeon]
VTLMFLILILTAVAGVSGDLYLDYIQKADSLSEAGQFDSSLAMARQARDEAAKFGEDGDTLVARALYRMGACCYRLSNPSQAKDYWAMSLEMWKKLRGPNHPEVAECIYGLAEIAYDKKHYARAESLYVRAADIWKQLDGEERIKLARSLNAVANSLYKMGQYPKAEHMYYNALDVCREAMGERHEFNRSLMANIGLALIRMGNNEAALSMLTKAAALLEEECGPDSPILYHTLCSMGLIYRRYAEYSKAASCFERTIKAIEDSLGRDNSLLTVPLLNLGKVSSSMGRSEEAERHLLRYLDVVDKCCPDRDLEIAGAVTTLAKIYYDRGDSASFEKYYRRARSNYEESLESSYSELPSGLLNFSHYFRFYDGNVSLEFARHGFELRRNYLLGNYLDMSEAEALRFSWYMRQAASYYLSSYLDLLRQDSSNQVTAADIIFASKGQVSDEIFERNRAMPESVSPEVRALRDSLGEAKIRLSSAYVSGHGVNDLGSYRTERDSLITRIDYLESALAVASSDRTRYRESQNISTSNIAEVLPDGSALVEYLRYEYVQRNPDTITTRYLVVVLMPEVDRPMIHDLGPADVIEDMVSDYHLHMQRISEQGYSAPETDQEYRELAMRLFNNIWKPIASEVDDRHLLLIAPDVALNLISFAGLPDEQGHFLAERFPIHYLSSGRDAIWLQDEPGRGEKLLALGDPDYDASARERKAAAQARTTSENIKSVANYPGVPDVQRTAASDYSRVSESHMVRLPATRSEVERISGFWRQNHSDNVLCFLGKEASEDNLKKNAPGSRVIHIATHGFFDPAFSQPEKWSSEPGEYSGHFDENPLLQSGLFLAGSNLHGKMADSMGVDDGILTAEEVSMLNLIGVEWVVLSACGSGLGEVETGEGVYGLRRAFQMAGARTVISSLWSVSDRSSAEFMISLYRASDQRLYERIHQYQKAQIEKLRTHGYSDHPYQWAAFIATGDWR